MMMMVMSTKDTNKNDPKIRTVKATRSMFEIFRRKFEFQSCSQESHKTKITPRMDSRKKSFRRATKKIEEAIV